MQNLHNILACPICKTALDKNACSACNLDFSGSQSQVPSFICREMYQSDAAFENALRTIDFWGKGWEKRLEESDHAFIFDLADAKLRDYANEQIAWTKKNKTLMGFDVPLNDIQGKIGLNIGCGAGTEALTLASCGAQCISMDITKEAATAANNLLGKIEGGFGIQADARFIPVLNNSVDFVYSSGVLHHSADIEKSVSEVFRVLKPGGKAYVMLYAKWSITFLQEKLLRWTGEKAWETGGRKNPLTDVFSVAHCRELFPQFESVSVHKRGGSFSQLAKIGRFLPRTFDGLVDVPLGPNLNIVATKA